MVYIPYYGNVNGVVHFTTALVEAMSLASFIMLELSTTFQLLVF